MEEGSEKRLEERAKKEQENRECNEIVCAERIARNAQ
jgi:hypothetical protein